MSRILAFGDSFVLGDLDDFGPSDCNYNPKFPPTHDMQYDERIEFLKTNVSFAALLSKKLEYDLLNFSLRGCSNFVQLDKLINFIIAGKLKPDDVILFGLTTLGRDRLSLLFDLHENKSKVVRIVDYEIQDSNNWEILQKIDYFYILSILNQISVKYNVPIIKFNLFTNEMKEPPSLLDYHSDNFIGLDVNNNTLIDVLNDTWGSSSFIKNVYHTDIKVPAGYEHLYTWNRHPSIEGHKKIADWFFDIIDWDNLKNG